MARVRLYTGADFGLNRPSVGRNVSAGALAKNIEIFCSVGKQDRLNSSKPGHHLKALAKQVGHLDEEDSAVAPEAGLKRSGKRIEAVAIEIVVIADVESGAGIRRVAEQELSLHV